jgi:diacylglycerol kinase (ATP)
VKTRFIVNARSGAAARALPAVRVFATKHGADLAFTERSRHASELAAVALAENCELIVAVGGDGTMNEVASVLTGTSATFGLVPCGSGDGLGRHLRIHGSVAHALALLHSGSTRLIDTGYADGHPFFTVAGLGFEAHIAEKFNRLQRRGFLRYLTTSATAFWAWQPIECVVDHSGRRERVTAFTLTVANANQYGNGARIAPRARLDDGLLDLCVVSPVNAFNAVPLLVRLFSGRLTGARGIIERQAARFVIERPAVGPIHTDGEVHAAGATVEFTIRPASLRIVAPAPVG